MNKFVDINNSHIKAVDYTRFSERGCGNTVSETFPNVKMSCIVRHYCICVCEAHKGPIMSFHPSVSFFLSASLYCPGLEPMQIKLEGIAP